MLDNSQRLLLDPTRYIPHRATALYSVQFNEYSIKEARIFPGVLQFRSVASSGIFFANFAVVDTPGFI